MAGASIRRAYKGRVQAHGGTAAILDRIAAGGTITEIARAVDVSPSFLHYFLVGQAGGRAAIHLARLQAVESAARTSLEKAESKLKAAGRGASDAMMWLQSRGGFRKVAGSESSVNQNSIPVYVSERQREMGRLHLEAALKRAAGRERLRCPEDVAPEPEPEPRSDPTDALLY